MEREYNQQYTTEEFESFMKAMKGMSDMLRSEKPDYIFAPVLGSVPLVDVLSIIDRHFPLENVEYPPNSSRFLNREELIDKWYSNFLNANFTGRKMSIACVDEVISGSSATKGYKEFEKVLYNLGRERGESLERKINYKVFGVGERPNGKRNRGFTKLVNRKQAKVFETKKIITADNSLLNPIRLKKGEFNPQGRQTYLPEIEFVSYPQEYLSLLYNVATHLGVDPDQVSPKNIVKMQESLEKYLRD